MFSDARVLDFIKWLYDVGFAGDNDSNSWKTRTHDKKSVIGIFGPCCRLCHAPTSTCKVEYAVRIPVFYSVE